MLGAGSIQEILSSITNQYNGNGLQQGASLTINAMLQSELKNNPVLLWMNGDVNYARSERTTSPGYVLCMLLQKLQVSMQILNVDATCSGWGLGLVPVSPAYCCNTP